MDLDDLLRALRRGDLGAREQFGLAVREELYRFFASCFVPTDADELTQETFMVVWKKLDDFEDRGPGYFARWMTTIASNKARAHRQAPKRELARKDKLQEHQAMISPAAGPATDLLEREQVEHFERCKDELVEDDRKILDQTLAGRTDREIAEEEDIKSGSVRSRRHRAKRRVQEAMQARRKTPESERTPQPK